MQTQSGFNPSSMVGGIRRFGKLGPLYEVTGIVKNGSLDNTVLRIHVLESDENAEYPASLAVQDPAG